MQEACAVLRLMASQAHATQAMGYCRPDEPLLGISTVRAE
jgi:hypothetical protein